MYGSAKSSSGSTPSESSGSAPFESSSDSEGIIDSSSSGSSGSSGACSFYIHDILLGPTDDVMEFSVTNDGAGVLEITGILSALGGVTLDPDTPLPIFLLSGVGIVITVNSNPPFTDLRGSTFTVETSCGDQSDVSPVA